MTQHTKKPTKFLASTSVKKEAKTILNVLDGVVAKSRGPQKLKLAVRINPNGLVHYYAFTEKNTIASLGKNGLQRVREALRGVGLEKRLNTNHAFA